MNENPAVSHMEHRERKLSFLGTGAGRVPSGTHGRFWPIRGLVGPGESARDLANKMCRCVDRWLRHALELPHILLLELGSQRVAALVAPPRPLDGLARKAWPAFASSYPKRFSDFCRERS
jgi:hypothetical protein